MAFHRMLKHRRIWRRIFYERLTEPLHLNAISLFVAALGSFERKVEFDLVLRAHNAFGILRAAQIAAKQGVREIVALEFGVAAGAGLLNMSMIAVRVEAATGVRVRVVGFDSGSGMPPPVDYRDHPDLYVRGDYQMDFDALQRRLPAGTSLILGPIDETVPKFLKELSVPIGYVVIDVDYWSSTCAALRVFDGQPEQYLPMVICYVDDIQFEENNSWCGELLAIREFNDAHPLRKIERCDVLLNRRIFKRAPWLRQIFYLHVLDHPARSFEDTSRPKAALPNPYL